MEEKNIHKEIINELEDLSPKLAEALGKKKLNTPPHGYFDKMQSEVMASLAKESASTVKVISLAKKSNLRIFLAAATVIGLILISTFIINRTNTNDFDLAILNSDEIKTYLIDHAYELDDEHLSQLPNVDTETDLLELTDEELQPVLEDYLYQIENSDLN